MDAAVVGNQNLIALFRLVGVEAVAAEDEDSAVSTVRKIVEKGDCKLLFLTEKTAAKLKDYRQELLKERKLYPIFVIIPDFDGFTGTRRQELHESVNRSMGVKLKTGD